MTDVAEPLNRGNMNGVGAAIGQVARNREYIIDLQQRLDKLGGDGEGSDLAALDELKERLDAMDRRHSETLLNVVKRIEALENPPKRKPGRPRKHPKPEEPQQEASA